ncbi:LysR family transcriptional regulator [Microbacteriaceae bacterium VKM Ac-2854]|nr:LysR family transcriptional regulator [Microbacteriaceae bacterium VKM Ac-2854]
MHDLSVLQSFVAVIDHGSVVAAARETGYSPAAVSRHLASLERELGLTLFRRTARSIQPSVAARVLAEKARLLLDEAAQFEREAKALARGDEGVIRLAYFRAVGTTIVPRLLAALADARPNLRVTLIECSLSEEVAALLHSGGADIGFLWGHTDLDDGTVSPDDDTTGLVVSALFSEALVLLTALDRGDLHEDPHDLARLAGEDFAMAPGSGGSPPVVQRMFLDAGLPTPNVTHRPLDHAMQRSLIAAGLVVSLTPALGVSDEHPGVRRSAVSLDFRRTYIAHPRSAASPLLPVMTDAIRAVAAEMRGFGIRYLA